VLGQSCALDVQCRAGYDASALFGTAYKFQIFKTLLTWMTPWAGSLGHSTGSNARGVVPYGK
jgi:hypothetical protein